MFSASSDPTLLLTFPADWTCKTGIRNPFVPGYTPAATPVVPLYIYSSPSSSLNPDGAPSSLCSFLGSINDFHCLNPTKRHSVNSNVSLAILEKPSCNHSSRGNKIAANSLLLLSNPREITREDEYRNVAGLGTSKLCWFLRCCWPDQHFHDFSRDRELEGLRDRFARSIAIKVCVILRNEFIAYARIFSLRFELLSSCRKIFVHVEFFRDGVLWKFTSISSKCHIGSFNNLMMLSLSFCQNFWNFIISNIIPICYTLRNANLALYLFVNITLVLILLTKVIIFVKKLTKFVFHFYKIIANLYNFFLNI